jgi:hypothetical protein
MWVCCISLTVCVIIYLSIYHSTYTKSDKSSTTGKAASKKGLSEPASASSANKELS